MGEWKTGKKPAGGTGGTGATTPATTPATAAPATTAPPRPTTAAPGAMGNAATGVLARPAPGQVPYDPKALSDLLSAKGKMNNSILAKIIAAHGKARAAEEKQDPVVEVAALDQATKHIDAWKKKHADDTSDKQTQLTALQQAIAQRLPAVQEAARATWAREEVGLPPAMIIQLGPAGVATLRDAYRVLLTVASAPDDQTADDRRADADAKLKSLAPQVGGSVGLVRAMVMRHAAPDLNPGLDEAMSNPKYSLGDKATAAKGAARANELGTDRLTELQTSAADATNPKQGVAKMELGFQGGKLGDLSATAKDVLGPGTPLNDPKHEKKRKAAQKAKKKALKGMTEQEATAILAYTSNGFTKFNAPLRDDASKLDGDQEALTKLAISALNRMKPETGPVFRHGGLFPGFKEVNQVGAKVVDMGFLSTARDQPGCLSGAVSHEVLEIITSKSGRDVSHLSLFGAGEREVLFKPGTRFRVTEVHEVANGARTDGSTDPDAAKDAKKSDIKLVIHKTEV